MWKIIVAFIIFAALAMFVIVRGGDKLDMGGEKHGEEAVLAPPAVPGGAVPPAASKVAPASAAK
jgi:hypothetical protein